MTEELKTLASVTSSHREREAPTSGLCLGTDEILAFVQGQIPDEGLEQVHAHVDECEACQCLVAEAAHALDSEPISESIRTSWNTVFQPSTIVGKRYRILRLVARGGMGEVYEAYDSALHERVALKTVTSTSCDNAQAVRYLKAEVQLARRISHPNVCRIYDLGTHQIEATGHEIYFLVMEFVEGECLGKKLRQGGAFPLDQAQSVAQQLLFGLRAAHDAGILHRDFKSDNVMLRTESDGKLTPVILDFGLAKAMNESGLIATTQSSQAMVGTLGYMAPEQIEGAPLSTASDLYAFGVVWFELLTGKLPFDGDTPVATAMARLHRAPMAPSALNPNVPVWLDEVVLRCLRRHPAERFTTAEHVLEDWTRRRESQRVPTVVPARFRRRSSFAPLAILAILVCGVAVTAFTLTHEWRRYSGASRGGASIDRRPVSVVDAPAKAPSSTIDAAAASERASRGPSIEAASPTPSAPTSAPDAATSSAHANRREPLAPSRGAKSAVLVDRLGARATMASVVQPMATEKGVRTTPTGSDHPTRGEPATKPSEAPTKAAPPLPTPSNAPNQTKKSGPDWLPIWSEDGAASKL
jgi:serine/threonine protein kinase